MGKMCKLGQKRKLRFMRKSKKSIIAVAAIAGLLAGTLSSESLAVGVSRDQIGKDVSQLQMANDSCASKSACNGKHYCKGRNDCKGLGGCKSGDNGCQGKNSCKGKGGCNSVH